MAFTETQKVSITDILGITLSLLNAHLTSLGTLSPEIEADVIAQIALWEAGAGTNYLSIEPKESNLGTRLNGGDARAGIRRRVATDLEYTGIYYGTSPHIGTICIDG